MSQCVVRIHSENSSHTKVFGANEFCLTIQFIGLIDSLAKTGTNVNI